MRRAKSAIVQVFRNTGRRVGAFLREMADIETGRDVPEPYTLNAHEEDRLRPVAMPDPERVERFVGRDFASGCADPVETASTDDES